VNKPKVLSPHGLPKQTEAPITAAEMRASLLHSNWMKDAQIVAQQLSQDLALKSFERVVSGQDRSHRIWIKELELQIPSYCATIQRYWKRGAMKPGNLKKFNPNHMPIFTDHKIRDWMRLQYKEKKALLMEIIQFKDCEVRQRQQGILFEHMDFDVSGFELQSPYTPLSKGHSEFDGWTGAQQDPNEAISRFDPYSPLLGKQTSEEQSASVGKEPVVFHLSFWADTPSIGFEAILGCGTPLPPSLADTARTAHVDSPSELLSNQFLFGSSSDLTTEASKWNSFETLRADFSFFRSKFLKEYHPKTLPFTKSTTGDTQTPSGSPLPKMEGVSAVQQKDLPDQAETPTSPRDSCELEAQDTVDERFFTLGSGSRQKASASPSPEHLEPDSSDPSNDWPIVRDQTTQDKGFVLSTARRVIKTSLPKSRVSMKNPRISNVVV
jgi:hypothetical protein